MSQPESKISILHILTSHAWGGLELYVITLIKKLIDEGIKTALYCIKGTKVDVEAQNMGIPIFYGFKQARISFRDIYYVRKILKNEFFNNLHTHTRQDIWLGSLVKMSLPVKLIHSLYMSAPSKKDIFHKIIYQQIDSITSSSLILNERIKKNYPIAENKIHLLRYGREQNDFQQNEREKLYLRKLWSTQPGEIIFATMCRIDPAKGVQEIAESLLLLPSHIKNQIKLWIIGEPTLLHTDKSGNPVYEPESAAIYEWLKNFAAQHNDKIVLIPFQKNINPYLNAIDVFILATYKETYSLSVLDAMSAGVPVIGTNSGGTPEQVKHLERGYLIETKSAKSIANAIEYYVENQQQIKQHGLVSKAWVKKEHDWNLTIQQLKQYYK